MTRSQTCRAMAAFERPTALQSPFKGIKNEQRREWFRFENADASADTTHVYIYDMIGGWFGVTAEEMLYHLRNVETGTITLHINSPGGDVFEGTAIYNALRSHKSKVHVVVDGLAASAASFIAQAGDSITMNPGSMMMIHDASAGSYENAEGHRFTAVLLDKISDNIAEIYAGRAGDDAATWREVMKAEAWYTAKEAVDVGLADTVGTDKVDEDPTDKWDLSIFNFAGRDSAPSPYAILNQAKKKESPKMGDTTEENAPATEPAPQDPEQPTTPGAPGTPEVPVEETDEQKAEREAAEDKAKATNSAVSFFMCNGQKVTDSKAVQAHINGLEGFQKETSDTNRREFVKALASDGRIPASKIDDFTNHALSIKDDSAYQTWANLYKDMPANPTFAKHGETVTNANGDTTEKSALEQQLDTARAIVNTHRKSNMKKELLEATASYQLLKQHNTL